MAFLLPVAVCVFRVSTLLSYLCEGGVGELEGSADVGGTLAQTLTVDRTMTESQGLLWGNLINAISKTHCVLKIRTYCWKRQSVNVERS